MRRKRIKGLKAGFSFSPLHVNVLDCEVVAISGLLACSLSTDRISFSSHSAAIEERLCGVSPMISLGVFACAAHNGPEHTCGKSRPEQRGGGTLLPPVLIVIHPSFVPCRRPIVVPYLGSRAHLSSLRVHTLCSRGTQLGQQRRRFGSPPTHFRRRCRRGGGHCPDTDPGY